MSQVSGLNASSRSSLQAPSPSQYHVHKGDTLSGIAARHGVSLGALERANPGIAGQRFIFPGDKLTIPASSGQASGQNTASHTIQRGETLSSIAAKHGTTVQAIADANPGTIKNVNHIYPGDTIVIPSGGRAERALGAQTSKASGASAPVTHMPVSVNKSVASAASSATVIGQINLREFFDPSKGSQSPAAIIIGNAEGNRTPSGGERAGYKGHIDPGNGKGNRGSFSYQHGTKGMTPQQADHAQLAKLSKLIPAYEAAAKKAGLDPNNATLATAYFDLFNQSESAAGRFLGQIGDLKATGITNQSVTELRFHSFVDKNTGRRFAWTDGKGKAHTAGGGFAKIASNRLGHTPSEKEIQAVVRADQARRQNAMVDAMKVQGFTISAKSPPAPLVKTTKPEAISQAPSTGAGILTKWPVSNPVLNKADKKDEGDGHYDTPRTRGKHGGIDLVGKVGDPIFAAGAGRVVKVEPAYSEKFGYQLAIDHGNGIFTQYAHLQKDSLKVKIGDKVTAGQNIASMGRTGNTPPLGDTHLHFEVRIGSAKPRLQGGKTVDPLKYLGRN